MTEIMVAIDGCEHSPRIVDTATQLAKSLSAKVVLVYVAPKLSVPDEYAMSINQEDADTEDYYQEFSQRVLGDLDARAEAQQVPVETLFGVGHPAEFILEKAKERGTSMIVIGVHGLRRLGRLKAFGSTSRRLIEDSTIPVVAVP